jgi:hypothetical protein
MPLLVGGLIALHACAPRTRTVPTPVGASSPPRTTAAMDVRLEPIGRYEFESPHAADPTLWPEELSGLAWIEADQYVAIGDAHAALHRLTVRIDPATGSILGASTDRAIPLLDSNGVRVPEPSRAEDREGIVYDRAAESVWIANEHTEANPRWPSLERHRLADGLQTGLIRYDSYPALSVFGRVRPNRGFEALARADDGSATWTANEEALTIDGPPSTDSKSGVVRLLRFDRAMRPSAQYAYVVDPYPAPIKSPLLLAGKEISGLSELAVLPDGRLLALERAFAGDSTGSANLRTRLYLVSIAGATDVAKGAFSKGLIGADFVPVQKRLLWERSWGLSNSNFEGMALGPPLSAGGRLLLLMADNNAGTSQALFALRLTGF